MALINNTAQVGRMNASANSGTDYSTDTNFPYRH